MKLQIRKKKVKKSCQVQTPLKYKAQQDFQNTVLESFYNEEFDKPDDEISSPPITRSPISSGHTPPKITNKSAETD